MAFVTTDVKEKRKKDEQLEMNIMLLIVLEKMDSIVGDGTSY